jgi:capsular exopolysaccharide synthesis family protein
VAAIKIIFPARRPVAPELPAVTERTSLPAFGSHQVHRDSERGVIVELWRFLRRHPATMVVLPVIGVLLALAFTLMQTPIYQAAATLEIQELNENFLNFKEVLPVSQGAPAAAPNDIATQLRILRSKTLVDRVLNRVPQERRPGPSTLERLWRKVRGNDRGQASDRDRVLEEARENLDLRETRQSRIVDITYDSPDPAYAADFVNALSQEYIEQNIETRWRLSQYTGDWLARQLDDMRKKLGDSEDRLQGYAHNEGLLFTSDKQSPSEDKLRQVQEALSKAQEDRMNKQARMETAASASPEAVPDQGDTNVSLKDYETKLTDLRRQRAELVTVFKPNFDAVRRLDAQIVTLEDALKAERVAILARIRNDYRDAVRREGLLQESYSRQIGLVSNEAEKAIQYGILKREVDTNRQLYEVMLQRVAEARISSAMRASNVRIIDPATPPARPYKPAAALNLLWGLTAGSLCGMVIAVVHERFDRRIRKPGDLGFYLNVPELGAVPLATWARPASLGYRQGTLPNWIVDIDPEDPQTINVPATTNGSGKSRVELAAWQQCESLIAESFRSILTSILFSNPGGKTPQVIVITSAMPLEGKTTVASNVAAAIARIHRRVLLIDGDLRRPRLHEVFGVSNDYGLTDLLTVKGNKGCRDLLPYVVQKTAIPGMGLLAAGPSSANATDLLHSTNMADVLKQAGQTFDSIVIDTPPMLDMPDARVLGRFSDGVVLVVRAGVTTRETALTVKQRLMEDGTALLGAVLNRWSS